MEGQKIALLINKEGVKVRTNYLHSVKDTLNLNLEGLNK